MRIYFFIFVLCSSFPVNAIYDNAEISIIPNGENINFCFNLDKRIRLGATTGLSYDSLYLVGTLDQQNFFSILPTADKQSISITPFKSDNNDFFQDYKYKNDTICSGNIPKTSLNNLKLFAGVGKDLTDVIQNQKYLQVFNGFINLPQPEKEWTVMVYMVGANLETNSQAASKDILEMLSGTQLDNQNKVNVVLSTGGSKRSGWHNLKRTLISQGQSYSIEDKGNITPSTPENLTDFVMWSKNNFPAQHYALVLWNHGMGIDGFGEDDYFNSKISLPQLKQAYQTIRAQFTKPLDIVIYDACLMGTIEVAEITSNLTSVMASSTDSIPSHGLDYQYLLSNLITNSVSDGISFGKLAKAGYLDYSRRAGTYKKDTITYSVYDLAKLAEFTKTFEGFATEFKSILKQQEYNNYANLSQGIIRAPGYPQKCDGKNVCNLGSRSLSDNQQVRIDLYNVLQTVSPDFATFGKYAQTLLTQLDQMVVDYESNLSKINPNAGKISININAQEDYLSALPAAYTILKDGLKYYNERRKIDTSSPDKIFVCPQGLICADAKWLQLPAEDTVGVTGYYGQSNGTGYDAHLIKSLYKHQTLTQSLEIPVDGKQACRVELCVSPTECEGITLSEMGEQRLAEVQYNQSPALLTFCKTDNLWMACSVLPKTNGVWGRESSLSTGDTLTPNLLSILNNQTQQRMGKTLTVQDANTVLLQEQCDTQKASVVAGYAGFNQTEQFERLCDKGDCFCKESDLIGDEACKRLGVKSGVFLKY